MKLTVYLYAILPKKTVSRGPWTECQPCFLPVDHDVSGVFRKKKLSAQKEYHEDMFLSTADRDGYMTIKVIITTSELTRDLRIVVSQSHGRQR